MTHKFYVKPLITLKKHKRYAHFQKVARHFHTFFLDSDLDMDSALSWNFHMLIV